MKKVMFVSLACILVASASFAADFLTSARGGGLGFSYFLLPDGPSGALYNPSTLGYVRGWQTQLMYERLSDLDYRPVVEKPYYGHFGLAYQYPTVGTFALNSVQSGSFSKLTNIPTFNHLALSYGRQLSPIWSVGSSAKYVFETGFGKRSAFDFDLGFTFNAPQGFTASAAFENLIRSALTPDYRGVREFLPRRARAGAGYLFAARDFQFALLTSHQVQEWGIGEKQMTGLTNIGTEWWFLQNRNFAFAVRGGYTFGQELRYNLKTDFARPTAGLSLGYKIGYQDIRLDYAWQAFPYDTPEGSKPGNHFVALTLGFGGIPHFRTPPEQRYVSAESVEPAETRQVEAEKPRTVVPEKLKPVDVVAKTEVKQSKPAEVAPKSKSPKPKPAEVMAKAEPEKPKPAGAFVKAEPEKPKPSAAATKPSPEKPKSADVVAKAEPGKTKPAKVPAGAKPEQPKPAKVTAKAEPEKPKPAAVATQSGPDKTKPAAAPEKTEQEKSKPAEFFAKEEPKKPEPVKMLAQAEPEVPKPAKIFKNTEMGKEGDTPLKDKDTDFKNVQFFQFNAEMEVSNISTMDVKKIVFYVRPLQVVKTASWKLYIFKAKIKTWSEEEAGRWAVAAIDGKGVPPINIIWDGLGQDGQYVPSGKYFYLLTAESATGEKYATKWFSFKLE
jgi:hypothetical protein